MSAASIGEPIEVRHAAGSYPVHVAPGLLAELGALAERYLAGRCLVAISDAAVARLHAGGLGCPVLTFPAGEASKTRETWARLSDALLAAGFGRDAGLVALGGGVTGDLAGFVAATFLRGVPYVQVPTTLLAMLDASVGGKTGVDTPQGKNLIGAFHPPAAVLIDPRALATLPERDFRSGLAEAVKHGLIADRAYFEWIGAEAPAILARDEATLTALVRRSVEIKAAVVSADERETGLRATLNAGHTVAHALEHVSEYALTHGEAVALGLVAETALAERLGVAPAGTRAAVAALLERLGLPVTIPPKLDLPPGALVEAMAVDKKNRASSASEVGGANRGGTTGEDGAVRRPVPRFALPTGIGGMAPGDGRYTMPAEPRVVREALGGIGAGNE